MLSRKHETILTTSINYNYSDFLIQDETPTVYIPDITWENHSKILRRYKIDYKTYRYYDKNKMGLDYEGLKEDLLKAFEGSVIIFHLCGHNPTGADITLIQWFEIAEIAVKRKLLILFDAAYHGLASGCLRTDAEPIKIFYDQGIEFMVAQTFSKNMGLYGERIGALHLVPKYSEKEEDQCNPDFKKELWHLENIIRTTYSDPPIHGSKIVVKIWNDSSLRISWERELQAVVNRIKGCRQKFYKQLRTSDFSYIITNRGFYSIINLTKEQREILCEKFGIYLKGERINFAGLNDGDLTYLTKALNDVMDINN